MASDELTVNILESASGCDVRGYAAKDKHILLVGETIRRDTTNNGKPTTIVAVLRYLPKPVAQPLGERESVAT